MQMRFPMINDTIGQRYAVASTLQTILKLCRGFIERC